MPGIFWTKSGLEKSSERLSRKIQLLWKVWRKSGFEESEISAQDIEELEGFFGKSFHGQKSVTVSAEKFRQELEVSRYKNMTPEWLLENFFEEPLLGKQEQKLLRQQEKERIWENFRKSYEGMPIETTSTCPAKSSPYPR